MHSPSSQRILCRILQELADEGALRAASFSEQWVWRLEAADSVTHVFGYIFDLNSAASHAIANDKAATSNMLDHFGIRHVEHRLFLDPVDHADVASCGSWQAMLEYAETHDFQVVCKPNHGSGGRGVFLVSSSHELECAVHTLFGSYRSIAVSPFQRADAEFRVIMLASRAELVYSKERPAVVGDGTSTVAELVVRAVEEGSVPPRFAGVLGEGPTQISRIPSAHERVPLTWKHNLAEGACPRDVSDPLVVEELTDLARQTTRALGLSAAAVDILQVGGEHMVLEVNPGIMMERYALVSQGHYDRTKSLYRRLLESAFIGSLRAIPPGSA